MLVMHADTSRDAIALGSVCLQMNLAAVTIGRTEWHHAHTAPALKTLSDGLTMLYALKA